MAGHRDELHGERDDVVKRRIIAASRALKGATRSTREGLAQLASVRRTRRRALLVVEGGASTHVFLLGSGRVRLERASALGRTIHLAHCGRGDFVGDLTLTGAEARETVAVVEDTIALATPVDELRELAARDPGVFQVLGVAQVERCLYLEERLELLLLRRVEARLAAFLLYALDRWGYEGQGGIVVGTALRHHELATMLGTGREWVTMTLMRLRRERVLGAEGRRIVVRDLDSLRALASGAQQL